MIRLGFLILAGGLGFSAQAEVDGTSSIPAIVVTPESATFSPTRSETTEPVNVLQRERLEKSSLTSLNDAADLLPGVDSQDYCVNCGAKRISINGLRGDHTSVLIDDIPLYSAVTSVYGFDALSLQSVDEIEVRRGAGGALLNPEALGGSINILTRDPRATGSRVSVFGGDHGTQVLEVRHDHLFDDYRFTIGGETSRETTWDVDGNSFAESPAKRRRSFFAKQIWNLSPHARWTTRISYADLQIVGGNTVDQTLSAPNTITASDLDFDGGDVRRPYRGDVKAISEYVGVRKTEATSKLAWDADDRNHWEWNLAGAVYDQDSFYMHGFDYRTTDTTLYSDLRWTRQIGEAQVITIGASHRRESLRSNSLIMYQQNGIPKDDFDYLATSIFGKSDWFFDNGLEVSLALRLEKLGTDWRELRKLEREVAAPRLLMKWQHSEHLSQQLSFGTGYRMPLTSIESAHGAYDGFVVDITELEKSRSLVYSVSYNTPKVYVTPSVHYTRLENMSYPIEPEVAHGGPLRFVNDSEAHEIIVYDLLTGFKPTDDSLLEAGYETFQYPDVYTRKLPTAAIERRLNLRAEYEARGWTLILNGTWVGARDLSRFAEYPDHYNVSDGLLGVSDPKWQRAPDYWVWDASLAKNVGARLEFTLGVRNLFNLTQTGEGDSPAMWHLHDDHAHLDNRHVWGPNRGREVYAKIAAEF